MGNGETNGGPGGLDVPPGKMRLSQSHLAVDVSGADLGGVLNRLDRFVRLSFLVVQIPEVVVGLRAVLILFMVSL